MKTRNVT